MADYNLNVAFTNEQLQVLYMTGSNVVVAKQSGGSKPNVAWQVFRPMQANTLAWAEEYGIYASTSDVVNGAKLSQLSNVPIGAAMSKLYTLETSAVISGPASGGQANAFALQNLYDKPYMTVGLYQDATVNGTEIAGNATSAAAVIKASTAYMTPYTTVYIWIQSDVVSNSVVTTVTSPMTQLKYGAGISTFSVQYDSDSGKFINSGKAKQIEGSILYLEADL